LTGFRVITDPVQLAELAGDWDELVRRAEFPDVFLSWGFCWAWWQAFGHACNLRVVVLRDASGRLRLIAPFYSHRSSPRVIRVLGYSRADYSNLLLCRDDKQGLDGFFDWLRRRRDWRVVLLPRVPAEANVLHHFSSPYEPGASFTKNAVACARRPFPFVVRRWRRDHPRIDEAALEKLAGLLDDHKKYRTQVRKLQQRGEVQYQCISDSDEIRELLPEFMDLHVSHFTSKGKSSLFRDDDSRKFYYLLTKEFRSTNVLRLDILRLDDVILAAHFGFTWARRVYFYKPTYNCEFSSYSPGKLLLAYMIRDCHEQRAEELDLLFGNEPYKERYASDVRPTGSLQIWRSPLQAACGKFAQNYRDGKTS
jgi:CelD/BcsL family acetyltransferase involved in cellulose biosynthesis